MENDFVPPIVLRVDVIIESMANPFVRNEITDFL